MRFFNFWNNIRSFLKNCRKGTMEIIKVQLHWTERESENFF